MSALMYKSNNLTFFIFIIPIGALSKYCSVNCPTEKCISVRPSSHLSLTFLSSSINALENGGSIMSNLIFKSLNLFSVALKPRLFPEVVNCVKSIIASSPNLKIDFQNYDTTA